MPTYFSSWFIEFDDNENFSGVAVCYDIKPCPTTILELSIAGHKMQRYDADENDDLDDGDPHSHHHHFGTLYCWAQNAKV